MRVGQGRREDCGGREMRERAALRIGGEGMERAAPMGGEKERMHKDAILCHRVSEVTGAAGPRGKEDTRSARPGVGLCSAPGQDRIVFRLQGSSPVVCPPAPDPLLAPDPFPRPLPTFLRSYF